MQKVEPVTYVDLTVFGFDPRELVDHFIAPFVHALVTYVHLRVKDP